MEMEIYNVLKFNKIGESQPNYIYLKNGDVAGTRQKFQKHKLKDMLEIFDGSLSEKENMFNNGFSVMYDCGNYIFEYTKI